MTTTEILSNGGGYITSANATYATARTGSSLIVGGSSNSPVGQMHSGGYQIFEMFLSFDTSPIPDTDTVTAVDLRMWVSSLFVDSAFTVEARQYNWSSGGLTTADWVAGFSLTSGPLMASVATTSLTSGAYNYFTGEPGFLTATGMKTGTVYLGLSSSKTRIGTAPGASTDEYVVFLNPASFPTQSSLFITHAGAGVSPPPTRRAVRSLLVR